MASPMVQCNINVASQYHKFVIDSILGDLPQKASLFKGLGLRNRSGEAVGFQLCTNLRHVVPEDDDVVLLAVDVPHMVVEQ
jgi:hypothetical protein